MKMNVQSKIHGIRYRLYLLRQAFSILIKSLDDLNFVKSRALLIALFGKNNFTQFL